MQGANDDEFGERFFSMANAYDKMHRQAFNACAEAMNLSLVEGVYVSVLGPNFETAAEITLFQRLGATAVGMSTVPEVIVARHCGLRVCAISAISNYAEGLSDQTITHETALVFAEQAQKSLSLLLPTFMEDNYG